MPPLRAEAIFEETLFFSIFQVFSLTRSTNQLARSPCTSFFHNNIQLATFPKRTRASNCRVPSAPPLAEKPNFVKWTPNAVSGGGGGGAISRAPAIAQGLLFEGVARRRLVSRPCGLPVCRPLVVSAAQAATKRQLCNFWLSDAAAVGGKLQFKLASLPSRACQFSQVQLRRHETTFRAHFQVCKRASEQESQLAANLR